MTNPPHHWSSGMINGLCEDVEALACVALCPCVVFARNAKNITDGDASFFRTCMTYALLGGCWGTLACYVCGPLGYWFTCIPCYAARYRKQLRLKRGLPDVPLGDKEAHFLCHPCALSQEFREIKSWHSDIVIGPSKPTIDMPPQEAMAYLKGIQEMKR
ncbi:hypothetical protein GOP47_0015780 [Adiantum capillus-veneris]|uniref:Uncharacterized protein n=1 Tax=Adiantum capillus-veneris TaxID=13818 RepID=A0A9D4UKY0_ADICA|nr:hypothetical protein GOP47_0015780 [Adiantum capillus-veneris]